MITSRRGRAVAGLVLVGTLLAGCQSGGAPKPTPSSTARSSPLAAVYAILQGGAIDDESRLAQQAAAVDTTAQCMRDHGFELLEAYADAATGGDGADFDPLDRNSVAVYGYGLTTIPQDALVTDAFPGDWSNGEKDAYLTALYGTEGRPGCEALAWQSQTERIAEIQSTEAYQSLLSEFSSLWQVVDADPAIVELNQRWAECMADAGFIDLTQQADAGALAYESVQGMAPGDAVSYRHDQYTATELEIGIALADFDCRTSVDYTNAYTDVRIAYEQGVAERYANEVQELILTYGNEVDTR